MSDPVIIPDVASIKNMIEVDLGVSDWITVDQDQIDAFARATGDLQWIHTDVDRAKAESPFGETIAHGYLTIALSPVLVPQLFIVEGISKVVNAGIEKLRFREPVRAGSRLRLSGRIKDARYTPDGAARTTLALRWEIEGERRPACTANIIYVYYP
jgi:acyl dehydratase